MPIALSCFEPEQPTRVPPTCAAFRSATQSFHWRAGQAVAATLPNARSTRCSSDEGFRTMRMAILLASAGLLLSSCDLAQQAVENEIRAEVADRVEEHGNALRNSTDLDERYGDTLGNILKSEEAVRDRANREIDQRVGDAANAVTGRQQ
jgi:hypothetical protein